MHSPNLPPKYRTQPSADGARDSHAFAIAWLDVEIHISVENHGESSNFLVRKGAMSAMPTFCLRFFYETMKPLISASIRVVVEAAFSVYADIYKYIL
jgi:hypothetical protein